MDNLFLENVRYILLLMAFFTYTKKDIERSISIYISTYTHYQAVDIWSNNANQLKRPALLTVGQ